MVLVMVLVVGAPLLAVHACNEREGGGGEDEDCRKDDHKGAVLLQGGAVLVSDAAWRMEWQCDTGSTLHGRGIHIEDRRGPLAAQAHAHHGGHKGKD